ncbi:MAG: hypothetical protein AAFW84_35445 [Cyanobacteria bacterium J06635_15]
MSQPSTLVNIKLINSLAQVILSLSDEEQTLLEQRIQHLKAMPEASSPPQPDLDAFFQDLETLEPDPNQPSLQEISKVVQDVRHELWID